MALDIAVKMAVIYGYARVSTEEQSLDRQIDALIAAGVKEENIFREKMTGSKSNRPKLNALLSVVEKNDIIYVESLSRLSRNSADLLNLLQTLSDKGVSLVSLKESLDLTSATGKMMAQLISALVEFEKNNLIERVKEGLSAARARGRVGGRPPISEKIITRALEMYDKRNLTISEICKACSISRPTLYKALRQREDKRETTSDNNELDVI